ncbi:TylF/MycF/NovP-related O-methyltransferase [uncultured Desulfosarcina sp.]|uniref:TylF/MycF/NovP-related O-methyltransferase n=1 Tax=uncultured Desulfosarcina sp. TaxID=218289 RepID=UPI0029C7BD1D|nr:TylF/MycF/NovP-related O-methyltransferase [uncultured Desulfosarcina sp.]
MQFSNKLGIFFQKFLAISGYEIRKKNQDLKKYDAKIIDIINTVKPFTMTQYFKIAELCEAVRYIVNNKIPGAFVECGVWKGGSMMATAMTLIDEGDTERQLYLYDTFSGMTQPTEHDVSLLSGTKAIERFDKYSIDDKSSNWCYSSTTEVSSNMKNTGYPGNNIHLIAGKVEETIPEKAPEKISLLRLDTDWYESTKHELEHLYSRIPNGGILIIDDYDSWKGSRKAVDEFFNNCQKSLFLHRMGGKLGRIAVVY